VIGKNALSRSMRLLAALRGVHLAFASLGGRKAFGLRALNRHHKDLVPGRGLGLSLRLREKLDGTPSLKRCLQRRWFMDDVEEESIVLISLMGTVCLMGAVFGEAPKASVSLMGAFFGGAPIAPVSLMDKVLREDSMASVSLLGLVGEFFRGAPIAPVSLLYLRGGPSASEEAG